MRHKLVQLRISKYMKISDAHNDIFTSRKSVDDIKKYFTEIAQNSAVALLTGVLWTTEVQCGGVDVLRLLDPFKGFKTAMEIVLAIEDLNFLANLDAKMLSDYNIKYASLTWNFDNYFGGGAMGQSGLTRQGKAMIKSLKEQKIILDTAHLNRKSFFEVMDLEHHKIMCSHTNMDAVNSHFRNLTDKQIELIIQSGGFVGISLVTPFLTDKGYSTSADVIKHIDHFVQRFGSKGIGLGTDFFGTDELPLDVKSYDDLSVIARGLSDLGYSAIDLDNIFFSNYKNLLFS